MGVSAPSYRLFMLLSAALHLAALLLLPADVALRLVSLGAREGRGVPSPVVDHGFVLLDRNLPLRVVEIELPPRPATRDAVRRDAEPRREPSPPVTPETPSPPDEIVVVTFSDESRAATNGADASRAATTAAGAQTAPGTATEGVDQRDALLVPPVAVALVWPEIEPDGRRRGQTPVELLVHVTRTGEVSDVRVVESTGCAACEAAAIEAARRLRFRPAMRGATPVDIWWPFTFEFRR